MHFISIYDSRNKRGPASVATSPAYPGRRIGRADGLDRPILGHFAKKSSSSGKIQPAVRPPLSEFLAKKPSTFAQIQPTVQAILWAGLPTGHGPACLPLKMGQKRPSNPFSFFAFFSFLLKSEIFQKSCKIMEK